MKPTCLKLSEIVTTAGTQIRARIDTDTVDEYATAMLDASNVFPAVTVFHDGNQFILADGFHRVMAATRNGFKDINADVRKGTRQDALKFALGANSAHGLKRTNADKRRSVELALSEWPKLSDREIAKICGVHHQMVGDSRPKLDDSSSSNTRIGRDGKERKLPTRKPAPVEEQEPEPPRVTMDDQFVSAMGGVSRVVEMEPEVFTHENIVEFEATIADLQCLLRGECCQKDELLAIADNLKVCLKLVTKLSKEAA